MGVFLYINMTTIVCCLLFSIFLSVIYFSKKNMNNMENKIYRHLLIINNLELVATLLFDYCALINNLPVIKVVMRIECVTSSVFLLVLFFYILFISFENNKKVYDKINTKKLFYILYSIIFINVICHAFLPIDEFVLVNGELLKLTGIFNDFYLFCMALPLVSSIVVVAVNRKSIVKKKLSVFYVMSCFGVIMLIVYLILPQFFIVQLAYTLINYLMFFTIENPDMKMVNELNLARDQAEKANNAKSDFLSSMSHELRTPLNAIVGLSQVVINTTSESETRRDVQEILNSSNNLLELVDGILDINQIDSNNLEINNSNYKMNDLINDIIKMTDRRIENKNISFKANISSDIPEILYGDKGKIKTIILNLLTNAFKYTNEGFVELDVNCFNIKDKCNLRITVSDTGIGIVPEDIDKIFDKFYRSEENKDSNIDGTGLGLSITKSLVELLDGKITVNSNYGEGSTFTVTISQNIVSDNNTEIL